MKALIAHSDINITGLVADEKTPHIWLRVTEKVRLSKSFMDMAANSILLDNSEIVCPRRLVHLAVNEGMVAWWYGVMESSGCWTPTASSHEWLANLHISNDEWKGSCMEYFNDVKPWMLDFQNNEAPIEDLS